MKINVLLTHLMQIYCIVYLNRKPSLLRKGHLENCCELRHENIDLLLRKNFKAPATLCCKQETFPSTESLIAHSV